MTDTGVGGDTTPAPHPRTDADADAVPDRGWAAGARGRLRVNLLGRFEVVVDGRPVRLTAGRLRALLAMLAMSAGRVVSVDRLADAVWGEDPPHNARRSVQTYVTRLRSAIGAEFLGLDSGGYVLRCDADAVDVLRFLRLASPAVGDDRAERTRLVEALSLWRGDPFTGVPCRELLERTAPRLEETYLSLLERRVDVDLSGRPGAELAAELSEVAAAHPLRESLWSRLILVLERCGRNAEALERYEQVRSRIADELGVDPGPELQRIYAALLAAQPPAAAPDVEPAADRPAAVPRQMPADVAGFTGREAALARLDALADGGGSRVVLCTLHGLAGVGKTSLAVHWAHRARCRFPDGQLFVNLRGYGPGAPVEPLQALDAMLRSLGVPGEQIPADVHERAALLRTTLADRRVLVVLDNAADADQVRPLIPGSGCMVLVTSRSQLRGLSARDGAARIMVDRLPPAASTSLLRAALGRQDVRHDEDRLAELAVLCGHLPLALAIAAERAGRYTRGLGELVGELRDERARLDALEIADDAQSSVRVALSTSYAALEPAAARLFRLVGLHPGTSVSGAAAAALLGVPVAECRRLLDRLVDVHLVALDWAGRYTLHDLVRLYAVAEAERTESEVELTRATRRVHGWYAHSAARARLALDPSAQMPPLSDPEPGTEPLEFADAEQARRWFDAEHDVLVSLVEDAVGAGPYGYVGTIVNAMYSYLVMRHDPGHARRLQQLAVEACRAEGDRVGEAYSANQLGITCWALDDSATGMEWMYRALDLFEQEGDEAGQALVHGNLANGLRRMNRLDEAVEYLQHALRFTRAAGLAAQEARALNHLANIHLQAGHGAEAADAASRAVTILREIGDQKRHAHCLDTLGSAYGAVGRPHDAVGCFTEAAEILLDTVGEPWWAAVVLRNLAHAHAADGDHVAAGAAAARALGILDDLGAADSDELHRDELRRLLDRR